MPPRGAGYSRSLRCLVLMSLGQHSGRISPLRPRPIITFGFAGRRPCVRFPWPGEGLSDDSRSACRGDARRQRRDRPHRQTELVAPLSVQQKSAAMQPLLRSTTECIARTVSTDPRFGSRNGNLGDRIVQSMPSCTTEVRAMIEAYDRYFGEGEGEAFFMGPYLDVLPTAVSKWVRDAVK